MSCEWFVFFMQKTAYVRRISDLSSDVCSSDLAPAPVGAATPDAPPSARPPALSFNSLTMRWASLGPTPLARDTIALSPLAIAAWRSAGASVERIASATRAQTPWTLVNSRNQSRSAAERKRTRLNYRHYCADCMPASA